MEFALSDDLLELKHRARTFVDTWLMPRERELSRSHKIDPRIRKELEGQAKAAGLWMLNVPCEYGGGGLGLLARVVVWEEIGRTIALPPRGRTVLGPEVSAMLYHLTGELRERYLYPVIRDEKSAAFAQTEPDAGSDPASMKTTALRDGDVYVINGHKIFIGFIDDADFIQVIAATDPAKGSHGGISAFIVPKETDGVRIIRQIETMMRDRPFELSFTNVRIPIENRIGAEGEGFALAQGFLTDGRLRHAARAIGVIERCLELATTRAVQRETFGSALADRQAVQWMLIDMHVHLKQLRLMTYSTAAEYDRGDDVRQDSYICKYLGDELSFQAADRCMQIFGGLGLTTDTPIETFWRDQRSMIITEGPTEVLKMALARHISKLYGAQ